MTPPIPPEVLVVEDQFATRIVAADAISDIGLRVHEAGDADEALQELHDHPEIGVLFTDIQMPGRMDGLGLAEQVHLQRPDVELIVTSGGHQFDDSELPDNGTFLSKPYRASHLVQVVRQKLADRLRRKRFR
jgi:CheY-like chemotaxis protein